MKNIPDIVFNLLNKAKSLFMEEMNSESTANSSSAENQPLENERLTTQENAIGNVPKKIDWLNGFSAVINGLGIGLLLGILLGLSISPVVSAVIGTLSGILALLLGLNEKYLEPLKSIRIGSFGIFTVIGILIGLYVRANDPFAPSLKDKMGNYLEIGYTQEEARAFITHQVKSDSTKAKREAGVLYSSTVDAGACEVLQYATADQPFNELVNTFKEAGGTWEELAMSFSKDLPAGVAAVSLISMRDCFCSIASEGTIKITDRDKVAKLNNSDSLENIEKVLSGSGSSWQAIYQKISANVPENQRKEVYLIVIKVLTHD
jgi:hypothetical protein